MKKKCQGFIIIYVMMLMIPISIIFFSLLDLLIVDYKVALNIARKQQAYNNAVSGMQDVKQRIHVLNFSANRFYTYYLCFINKNVVFETILSNQYIEDYVKVSIEARPYSIPYEYVVKTEGSYKGFVYMEEIKITN